MNRRWSGDWYSADCSVTILSVLIRSMQEYPVLKPCCSFLMPLLILPVILLSIILEKSLFTVLSSVIPLQLLHVFKSPFFATLIITPIFQSLGNPSSCQILINSGNTMSMCVRLLLVTVPKFGLFQVFYCSLDYLLPLSILLCWVVMCLHSVLLFSLLLWQLLYYIYDSNFCF
jgi:hypothetical protein